MQCLLNRMAFGLNNPVKDSSNCSEKYSSQRPSKNQPSKLLLSGVVNILPYNLFRLWSLLKLDLFSFLSKCFFEIIQCELLESFKQG